MLLWLANLGFAGGVAASVPTTAVVRVTHRPLTSIRVTYAPTTAIDVSDAPTTRITVMADSDPYDIGDEAGVTATFKVAGVLTDPTTVQATVKPPGLGNIVHVYPSATLVKLNVGIYKVLVDCTVPGDWVVFWVSTGAAKGAEPGYFTVRPSPV